MNPKVTLHRRRLKCRSINNQIKCTEQEDWVSQDPNNTTPVRCGGQWNLKYRETQLLLVFVYVKTVLSPAWLNSRAIHYHFGLRTLINSTSCTSLAQISLSFRQQKEQDNKRFALPASSYVNLWMDGCMSLCQGSLLSFHSNRIEMWHRPNLHNKMPMSFILLFLLTLID